MLAKLNSFALQGIDAVPVEVEALGRFAHNRLVVAQRRSEVHPDEVTWITDAVAITNFFSAHDPEILRGHKARAVLCLDRELQGTQASERGVECIQTIHLVDGRNDLRIFQEAVKTLDSLVEKYGKVVVHCRAGRSRSVAVVAAYLKMKQGIEAEVALGQVRARRDTAVAPDLIKLVEACE